MKYSIRGNLFIETQTDVINLLNTFTMWKLENSSYADVFYFEVWLDTSTEKTVLFERLKAFVNGPNYFIDWHECTHDETIAKPCVIVEVYRG